MENRNSSLWIGLGVGSVIGALAYRFSRTSKAKKLKEKVCDTFHKITGQAEDMLDEAKEKAVDAGKTVADKMADKAFGLAEKTDDFKNKMHAMASEANNSYAYEMEGTFETSIAVQWQMGKL